MKHLKQVIFFDDYGLWMHCKKEAIKQGKKTPNFIAEKVEEFLTKKYGKITPLDSEEVLFIACEDEAKKLKMPISVFIERCCQEGLGLQPKPKWWELPRA